MESEDYTNKIATMADNAEAVSGDISKVKEGIELRQFKNVQIK